MEASIILMTSVAITLAAGIAAGAVLDRPLQVILMELCHRAERARFWVVYSKMIIALVPVFSVSVFLPEDLEHPAQVIPIVTAYCSGGLLLAVLAIGLTVWLNRGLADAPAASVDRRALDEPIVADTDPADAAPGDPAPRPA